MPQPKSLPESSHANLPAAPESQNAREAVPEATHALLALFSERLAEVKFPGIDAAELERLAGRSMEFATEVSALEEALEQVRSQLANARIELEAAARRGLGYAKVYAEDDPELLRGLDAIRLGVRARGRPPGSKKKRMPKLPTEGDPKDAAKNESGMSSPAVDAEGQAA